MIFATAQELIQPGDICSVEHGEITIARGTYSPRHRPSVDPMLSPCERGPGIVTLMFLVFLLGAFCGVVAIQIGVPN